jgi:hypothetical protein
LNAPAREGLQPHSFGLDDFATCLYIITINPHVRFWICGVPGVDFLNMPKTSSADPRIVCLTRNVQADNLALKVQRATLERVPPDTENPNCIVDSMKTTMPINYSAVHLVRLQQLS